MIPEVVEDAMQSDYGNRLWDFDTTIHSIVNAQLIIPFGHVIVMEFWRCGQAVVQVLQSGLISISVTENYAIPSGSLLGRPNITLENCSLIAPEDVSELTYFP